MRTRYNRGSFDSGLMKLLIFVIAVPSILVVLFGILNPTSAPAGQPTPPPTPPTPLVGRAVVTECNDQQLAAYGLSRSVQRAKTHFTGFNSDSWNPISDFKCWQTDGQTCDISWNSSVIYLCTQGGTAME